MDPERRQLMRQPQDCSPEIAQLVARMIHFKPEARPTLEEVEDTLMQISRRVG